MNIILVDNKIKQLKLNLIHKLWNYITPPFANTAMKLKTWNTFSFDVHMSKHFGIKYIPYPDIKV